MKTLITTGTVLTKMGKPTDKSKPKRITFPPGVKLIKVSKSTLKRLKVCSQHLPKKHGVYSAPLAYLCPRVVRAHVVRLSPKLLKLMGRGGTQAQAQKVNGVAPQSPLILEGGPLNLGGRWVSSPPPPVNEQLTLTYQILDQVQVPKSPLLFRFPTTPPNLEDVKLLPELVQQSDSDAGSTPLTLTSVSSPEPESNAEEEIEVLSSHTLEPIDPGFAEELNNFISTYVLGDKEPELHLDLDWDAELDFDDHDAPPQTTEEIPIPTVPTPRSYDPDSDQDILELMVDPFDSIPLPATPPPGAGIRIPRTKRV